MVHPGIVVAGVFGVVVTGVVIYSILKEEIDDFLQSFEHQKVPVGAGGHRDDDQQRKASDHNDATSLSSSGIYHGDYELRQRRPRNDKDDDDSDNEKELERTPLAERLQKIREAEANMAANQARLDEMERQMSQREAALLQSEERMKRELEQSRERQRQHDLEMALYRQEHLASSTTVANEPLIPSFGDNSHQLVSSEADSRANAILYHNLSSNHQENYNPFENSDMLLHAESSNSSVHGDGERSITVDDGEGSDVDWTEAEIGSVGSHDSYESWASPGSP